MSFSNDGEKKFVIKHVFNNVKKQLIDKGDGAVMNGPGEEHFGVEWKLLIFHNIAGYIRFYLDCFQNDQSNDWSIEAEFDTFVNGKKIGQAVKNKYSRNSLSNEERNYHVIFTSEYNEYSNNDKMPVEFRVTITKMTGIEIRKIRNFDDEEAKKHSDVVLEIGEQKFYVNRMYLSLHSTYFKSLFSGNFVESKKSEIELKDIDANDFQHFLELIHGDSLISANTVAGILKLADFFDSKTALQRCEEFLLNRSKQSLKFKFHSAVKYRLDKLKSKCMLEMNKDTNFDELAPENAENFSPEIWKELYKKAVSFI